MSRSKDAVVKYFTHPCEFAIPLMNLAYFVGELGKTGVAVKRTSLVADHPDT